jgi:hypothetical protein
MAPEQILQQKNSPATDMFALGSLLFLMAGQDEAPDMIKNIIHQLLMEKPADRPTASQLFKALDEWLKPNQPASALAGTGDPTHHTDPQPSNRPGSVKDVIKSLESQRSLKPLKVGGLILPLVLVAMALIYFSFNRIGPSFDNSSNNNPVAIEPTATALDLIPAHVFSGTNHLLNSISGDGKVFASYTHKNNLALYYLGDSAKKTDMALPFDDTLIALNQKGNLLAASNYMGNIAIVKIPTGKVLFAMQDKEYTQVENFGWGGKNSDVLLFSQNNKIFQLKPESQDKYPDVVSEIQDTKVFKNALKCDNITTHAGTDFFLANISVANNLKRVLMVYNLAENKTVKIISAAPVLERSNKAISSLGWVDNELIFATHNRNLFEYSLAPLNSPQDLIMPVVKSSELPSAPNDLIWLDTNHFIALTDLGEPIPSLYLYHRENLASSKKIQTNGEWVKQLKKLDGKSFAAFCESGKVLTYTLSKSLDK